MSWQIRVPQGESRGINGAPPPHHHHWCIRWKVIAKLGISVKVWKLRWRLEFELMGEPVQRGRETVQRLSGSRAGPERKITPAKLSLISDVLHRDGSPCHPRHSASSIFLESNYVRSSPIKLVWFDRLPSSCNFIIEATIPCWIFIFVSALDGVKLTGGR